MNLWSQWQKKCYSWRTCTLNRKCVHARRNHLFTCLCIIFLYIFTHLEFSSFTSYANSVSCRHVYQYLCSDFLNYNLITWNNGVGCPMWLLYSWVCDELLLNGVPVLFNTALGLHRHRLLGVQGSPMFLVTLSALWRLLKDFGFHLSDIVLSCMHVFTLWQLFL